MLLCSGLDPFAFIYLVYSALLYFKRFDFECIYLNGTVHIYVNMSELAKQQIASQAKAIEKTFNTTSDNEQESCSDNNNIGGCSVLSKHSAGDQIHYFSPIKKKIKTNQNITE